MNIAGHVIEPRYEISKAQERAFMKLAWLLPRKLAYWATIRVISHATVGKWEEQVVPELLALQALERWEVSDER